MYSSVLKSKCSGIAFVHFGCQLTTKDDTVMAVAGNNQVVLKQDSNLFDSEKKLKQACSDTLARKVTPQQREVFLFNHGVILLKMNRSRRETHKNMFVRSISMCL